MINDKIPFQIGLIAWLLAMAAVLETFFNILNPTGDPIWIVYGFGLVFGLVSAAAMDVKFNPRFDNRQIQVAYIGLLGGAGLMALQTAGQFLGDFFFSTSVSTSQQLRVLASVSEEFLFSMAVFGTLYMAAKAYGFHWIWAAIPTSIIFAFFHFFAYGVNQYTLFILFAGGLIIRWTYVKTKDVGAPILAHLINNGLIILLTAAFTFLSANLLLVSVVVVLAVLPFVLTRRR